MATERRPLRSARAGYDRRHGDGGGVARFAWLGSRLDSDTGRSLPWTIRPQVAAGGLIGHPTRVAPPAIATCLGKPLRQNVQTPAAHELQGRQRHRHPLTGFVQCSGPECHLTMFQADKSPSRNRASGHVTSQVFQHLLWATVRLRGVTRHGTQRRPSSEGPLPGIKACTCGWCSRR